MKYEFISKERSDHSVERMCRLLRVSRSGYYAWSKGGPSKRQRENEVILNKIREAYKISRGTYGSPRITDEIRASGMRHSRKRIARLMRINEIAAKTRKKFKATTYSGHKLPVAPNLLTKPFCATGPDRIWVSDITYVWTYEGWLYLTVILDLFSRRCIGWTMGDKITADLVLRAFNQAVLRRQPGPGLIFHSDRGVQYASEAFRNVLTRYGCIQSMSGKGNCYDNAVAESFFHTLKTEYVYFEKYETRAEAQRGIFEYIEVFYNRTRRHSAIGSRSPVDFERAKAA